MLAYAKNTEEVDDHEETITKTITIVKKMTHHVAAYVKSWFEQPP
jgi:hypothetical protein